MWPVIRHIGLIDTVSFALKYSTIVISAEVANSDTQTFQMISVCHIGYVSIVIYKSGGIWRNSGEEISRGMHQSEHLLLYVSGNHRNAGVSGCLQWK